MSDDAKRDDDLIVPAEEPKEEPKEPWRPGRRSEPPQPMDPSAYHLRDGIPAGCWSTAAHIGSCERCMAALHAHIADTIVELLSNNPRTQQRGN